MQGHQLIGGMRKSESGRFSKIETRLLALRFTTAGKMLIEAMGLSDIPDADIDTVILALTPVGE